jgi:hypothetical protein
MKFFVAYYPYALTVTPEFYSTRKAAPNFFRQ